jgi:hypothetical protein
MQEAFKAFAHAAGAPDAAAVAGELVDPDCHAAILHCWQPLDRNLHEGVQQTYTSSRTSPEGRPTAIGVARSIVTVCLILDD